MYHKKEYYVPDYKYERYKDLESDFKIPMKSLQNEPYKMDKYIQNPILIKKQQMKKKSSFKKYICILFTLLLIYIVFRLLNN